MVQGCLEALPRPHPPLSSLEDARRRVTVEQRFLAVQDTAGREPFARQLSEPEYALRLAVIADNASAALHAREIDDRYGIVQREHDLRRFLAREGGSSATSVMTQAFC